MFELVKVMTVIILNIWVFQLIMYYKEGADRDYEMSLGKPEIEKEIYSIVDKIADILE